MPHSRTYACVLPPADCPAVTRWPKEEDAPMVEDLQDPRRVEPSFLLEDRQMLDAWLEFHRSTLLLKCEGLDDDRLKARPVAPSKLFRSMRQAGNTTWPPGRLSARQAVKRPSVTSWMTRACVVGSRAH